MSLNKSSVLNQNKNSIIKISIVLVGVFVISCCILFVALNLFSKKDKATTKNLLPSHYGVFIRQDNELIELEEIEIFNIPTQGDLKDAKSINDSLPSIIIWQQNTQLNFLELYAISQYLNQSDTVQFFATPLEKGVIEIQPKNSLEKGAYCLIQGDPLSMYIPGWCFCIGAQKSNSNPQLATPRTESLQSTATQTPTQITVTPPQISENSFSTATPIINIPSLHEGVSTDCLAYENSDQPELAIKCWQNYTFQNPTTFNGYRHLARVYANYQMYDLSIIAGEVALSLATTTTDQATAYLSLGVSHYRLGENEKAIEFLTTGSQLETPDDLYTPDIYVWLGIVYQANNEKDLSCDAFQKALELGEKKNYTWAINNAKSGLEGCPSQ